MHDELTNSRMNGTTEDVATQRMGHDSAFITVFLRGESKVHCGGRQNFCNRSGSIAQAISPRKSVPVYSPGQRQKKGKADHIRHSFAFLSEVVMKGKFKGV